MKISYFLVFSDLTNSSLFTINKEGFRLLGLIISFLLFFIFLYWYGFKRESRINKDLIRTFSELENTKEQFSLYFLYFGVSLPLIEFIVEFFDIRQKESLVFNLLLGAFLLSVYFWSLRSKWVFNNIRLLFIGVFILYYGVSIYRIFTIPHFVSIYFDCVILFFLSYSVFKEVIIYWIYVVFNFILIILLFHFSIIEQAYFVVLFYSYFLIAVINHVRYVVNLKAKDNFLFADNIVNKGTSLILGVNKSGEVIYCSQNITQILGYTPQEVLGFSFWELTQDKEFTTVNYKISATLYTRKLRCKDGSFRYIQWKDSKYSEDVYVGIGQDVTETIDARNKYKNLIESATDIIFETDKFGQFSYINKFAQTILELNSEQVIGRHFSDFIREDYREKVQSFYSLHAQNDITPSVEFPIINASGKEIWISQNATVSRGVDYKVIGFSAIARDITVLKTIEKEQNERHSKIETFNTTINTLVTKPFLDGEMFEDRIQSIIKTVAEGTKIDRISYWKYTVDSLQCISLYELDKDFFSTDHSIFKTQTPIYFQALESDNIIVASDVYNNKETEEFLADYFPENGIQSMLDVPVMINGKLHSILCMETTKKMRVWDNDDINFARSIADVISLAIETYKRLETESKLELKTEILSAVAKSTIKLMTSKDVQSIFYETFEIIGKATKVDRMYFFQNNFLQGTMSIKSEWVNPNIPKLMDIPILQNMSLSENKFFINHLSKNKTFIAKVDEIEEEKIKSRLQAQGIITILVFPIFVKNNFYGFIGLDDCSKSRFWSEDEIGVLQILTNNIASAIERIDNENLLLESEQRFKLLANNIPGTVYLSDNDEKWSKLYINEQIENLTGFHKKEFLEKRIHLIDLVHPDDKLRVIELNKNALKMNEPFHLTYRLQKKSGEYIWVEEFGDAVIKDDKVQFLEGIIFDITEKKEIENEIKARELAEASSKAKSDFLANMSHEIRTPLNAIIGFTDLLKETKLTQSQVEYVTTVNQSADILLEVVNDILDFSKIETGMLDLEYKKTDLHEIANQIIDIIRFDSKQKGIALELTIDEEVPQYVSVDPLRIKQILLNLLSNAVKFTDKGKVELLIQLEARKEEKASIKFMVVDSGIGIKKDNHKKIFEPFSQEDSSTTRKYGGTGLGLAISNNILKLMGSKLELQSNYRKGSTFYFNLELNYCNTNTDCNSVNILDLDVEFEDVSHYITRDLLISKKVLVVEDNKINMMLARTLLAKILPNATIFEANNGKLGVEKCKELQPDIVLLDIQMPILNGYEAAIAIREFNATVPIIALTAGTIKGEKEKCIESGMNDYISKPINKDLFENVLVKWLQQTN